MPDTIGTVQIENAVVRLPPREAVTEVQPEERGAQREQKTEEARDAQQADRERVDARREADIERDRGRNVNVAA